MNTGKLVTTANTICPYCGEWNDRTVNKEWTCEKCGEIYYEPQRGKSKLSCRVIKKSVDDEAFERWWKDYHKTTISTVFSNSDTVEIAHNAWMAGVEWYDKQERL